MITGGSKMFWMFFMFVLFDPTPTTSALPALSTQWLESMKPLIDVGGKVAFLMLSAAVGVFGIS